jgi:hypothetical protein
MLNCVCALVLLAPMQTGKQTPEQEEQKFHENLREHGVILTNDRIPPSGSLDVAEFARDRGSDGERLTDDRGVALLIDSKFAGDIKRLVFWPNRITGEGMKRLHGLKRVESVTLIGRETLKLAPHLAGFESLKRVSITALSFGEGLPFRQPPPNLTADDLAGLKGSKSLRELEIITSDLDDDALKPLAEMPGLRSLTFRGRAALRARHVEAIAAAAGLESLSFQGGEFPEAALKSFGGLKNLRSLSIPYAPVGDRAAAVIAGLRELETLDLRGTCVGDEGVKSLGGLTKLKRLVLAATDMTGAGLAALGGLRTLEELDLGHTPLTDKHLTGLLKPDVLPGLRVLVLERTNAGDATLSLAGKLPSLMTLDVWHTRVSLEGLTALRKDRPKLNLGRSGFLLPQSPDKQKEGRP